MKIQFTLDLGSYEDFKRYAEELQHLIKLENVKNPTDTDIKRLSKLLFYENNMDDELYDCPDEDINIIKSSK